LNVLKWSLPPIPWNDVSDTAISVSVYKDKARDCNGHTMKSCITHHTSGTQSGKHSKFNVFTCSCEYNTTYHRNKCQKMVLLCSCLPTLFKNIQSL